MQKEKRNIIIGIFIGLILLVVTNLFSVITPEMYLAIGQFITYKWLINIILLLFLIMALILYYFNNNSKEISLTPYTNIAKPLENKITTNENVIQPKDMEDTYKYILENLSKDEKKLLRKYIDNGTKTREFLYDDGVANGLKSMKVLYLPSTIQRLPVFQFNIQPWAWEMLKKNPKYLD